MAKPSKSDAADRLFAGTSDAVKSLHKQSKKLLRKKKRAEWWAKHSSAK